MRIVTDVGIGTNLAACGNVRFQVFALSKLDEWLHNKRNSFLQFRLNAALRTVHRRHVAFQVLPFRKSPF